MAGYDGFSMSNRAKQAYEDGIVPASVIAKQIGRGATAKGVAHVLVPKEWHHTSKTFQRTEFYDLAGEIAKWAETRAKSIDQAKREIEDLIVAASKVSRVKVTHENCDVEWLEWEGGFKHPRAVEAYAAGCRVIETGGQFVLVEFTTGKTMKKRRDCRGFCVFNSANTIRIVNDK